MRQTKQWESSVRAFKAVLVGQSLLVVLTLVYRLFYVDYLAEFGEIVPREEINYFWKWSFFISCNFSLLVWALWNIGDRFRDPD